MTGFDLPGLVGRGFDTGEEGLLCVTTPQKQIVRSIDYMSAGKGMVSQAVGVS